MSSTDRASAAQRAMDPAGVAEVWSAVLDGQPVGPDDDLFFDLGGNSLLGAAVIARLAATTGLPLELRDLYLSPNPHDLAGYLTELRDRLAALSARLPPAGDWTPEVFAEALADLGSAAAESLLPPHALVALGPPGSPAAAGAARVAVLRRARGNGTCDWERATGHCVLRRQDATVRVYAERHPAGLLVRLTETPDGG